MDSHRQRRQEEEELHIVVLPWLALGHLSPFMELSKHLASKGHRISFLTTPKNIDRLPKVHPSLAHLINFVELHLPRIPMLPETVEATIDLPNEELRPYLSEAYDMLEDQFASFLERSSSSSESPPPDWVVHDYAPYWAPRVAARFGIPCALLSLFNATVLSFFGAPSTANSTKRVTPEQWTSKPDWVPFPTSVAFRPYEARELFQHLISTHKKNDDEDGNTVISDSKYSAAFRECRLIAVRSCTEFEPEWLDLLQKLHQKTPVVPLGFFPPLEKFNADDNDSDGRSDSDKVRAIFEWLKQQGAASVVYAAFGSEARLSAQQVREISYGLEQLGLPFIWVFRRPPGVPADVDMFPEGFEERTRGRGMVCKFWAPQSRILAHPAVGGFLTHCGWNSVIEGLQHGLALALLPMVFDQALNCRLLEEKGVAVEVPRDEDDGSFTGEGVAKTLRMVMVEEEGEGFRAKCREMRDVVFGDMGLQDRYLGSFVEQLKARKKQQPADAEVATD